MHRPDCIDNETIGQLTLQPFLDGHVVEELWGMVRERMLAGLPLVIVGDGVEYVGTPCLQVLIAAARAAKARRLAFNLKSPSAALTDAINVLGLQAELLAEGPA